MRVARLCRCRGGLDRNRSRQAILFVGFPTAYSSLSIKSLLFFRGVFSGFSVIANVLVSSPAPRYSSPRKWMDSTWPRLSAGKAISLGVDERRNADSDSIMDRAVMRDPVQNRQDSRCAQVSLILIGGSGSSSL